MSILNIFLYLCYYEIIYNYILMQYNVMYKLIFHIVYKITLYFFINYDIN